MIRSTDGRLDAYRNWNFEIIRRRITRNPGGGDVGAKANSCQTNAILAT